MSFATVPMDEFGLSELLHEAQSANERRGITGVLLYFDDVFLQVIEGEKPDICQLYDNIKNDDRNYSHTVIIERDIASRQFGDWSMVCEVTDIENVRRIAGLETIASSQDLGFYLQEDNLATKMLQQFSHRQATGAGAIAKGGRESDPVSHFHPTPLRPPR